MASIAGGGWMRLVVAWVCSMAAPIGAAETGRLGEAIRLYENCHYSAARREFRELATADGGDIAVDFYLGRLALWFDEERNALQHLERAVRHAPSEARVQNALGDAFGLAAQRAPLWEKLSWANKARTAYEKAVALAPENPAWRWSLLGYYCIAPRIAGGSMEKAFRQATEIRRLDPVSGRIAFATLHLVENRTSAAFAEFDLVLQQTPDDFLALYQIGRCAAVSGEQLARGRAALERCLQLSPPRGDGMPTRSSTHYRLGEILQRLGDAGGAERHFSLARDANPDFRAAKVALKN